MKKLFSVILLILFGASLYTYFKLPESNQDVPHIRWVIRGTKITKERTALFKEWLEENNYPHIEVDLDPGNPGATKNIVQGVSGVAGDILDCYEEQVHLYQSIGILNDLSDIAAEWGFDYKQTYPSIQSAIMVNGRQYSFPRNVSIRFNWINIEAFEKAGLSLPPDRWTFEEFEAIGKAFVKNSNPPGERQKVYFIVTPSINDRLTYLRSLGVDLFNETMTTSDLDSPLFAEVYEMVHRWIFESRIMPTSEEAKNLSSDTAAGSAAMNIFARGQYGLFAGSRWAIMFFRDIGPQRLAVNEYPHGGFRNTLVYSGSCAIYEGSQQKEVALYFLKFLTSEKFNRHIVECGDGLPPLPKYAETEEFLRPSQYPNEWGLHGRIRDMAQEIAMPASASPYILRQTVIRFENNEYQRFIVNRSSAKEAVQAVAASIDKEMLRKVNENPELAKQYEQGLADQAEIDRLRAKGELVPLHLISNPFYRKYYVEKGWSLPEGSSVLASIE